MENNPQFKKSFAIDFLDRFPGVIEHWQAHGDFLKKGLAIKIMEAANGGVMTRD